MKLRLNQWYKDGVGNLIEIVCLDMRCCCWNETQRLGAVGVIRSGTKGLLVMTYDLEGRADATQFSLVEEVEPLEDRLVELPTDALKLGEVYQTNAGHSVRVLAYARNSKGLPVAITLVSVMEGDGSEFTYGYPVDGQLPFHNISLKR